MGIVSWIIVGLRLGWLAGQVIKGGGYGVPRGLSLGFSEVVGVVGSLGYWESGPVAA